MIQRRDRAAAAVELLLDVGLRRRIIDSHTLDISEQDRSWSRWTLAIRSAPPSPAQIERDRSMPPTGILYVVERPTEHLREMSLSTIDIGFAALGDRVVGLRGQLWSVDDVDEENLQLADRSRRSPWARLGVMRVLAMCSQPLRQHELAAATGASQAAVSKSLSALSDRVRRGPVGWEATDRGQLWDDFLSRYPGPAGLASYWTSIASPTEQLRRCRQAAGDDLIRISGDWAADAYAPWRQPSRIVILAGRPADLESVLFGASEERQSTIEWRVPADPTIARTAEWYEKYRAPKATDSGEPRYVDPLIAAWDVARGSGTDVPSAVAVLKRRILRSPDARG